MLNSYTKCSAANVIEVFAWRAINAAAGCSADANVHSPRTARPGVAMATAPGPLVGSAFAFGPFLGSAAAAVSEAAEAGALANSFGTSFVCQLGHCFAVYLHVPRSQKEHTRGCLSFTAMSGKLPSAAAEPDEPWL